MFYLVRENPLRRQLNGDYYSAQQHSYIKQNISEFRSNQYLIFISVGDTFSVTVQQCDEIEQRFNAHRTRFE